MKTAEVLFIHSGFMKMAADPAVRARLRALLPNSRLVQDYRLDAPRSSTNFNPVIVWMTVLVLVLHDSSVRHDGWLVGEHLNMWISNRLLDSFRSAQPVWELLINILTIWTIAVKSLTQPVVEIKSMEILSLDQLPVLKNKSMAKCRTVDTYCLGLEARHHRVGELDICFPVGVLYRL